MRTIISTTYNDFWRLSLEEQKELLGETISFGSDRFYVVELDEASQLYNNQYNLLHIGLRTHNRDHTVIWIPSIDDGAYQYFWSIDSFPSVHEWMLNYMERTNYFVSVATIYANRKIMGKFEGDDCY
jgi:hypothetical protein